MGGGGSVLRNNCCLFDVWVVHDIDNFFFDFPASQSVGAINAAHTLLTLDVSKCIVF